MMTLSRQQARCLRAILRRSVLGLPARGAVPPVYLLPGPAGRVLARWVGPKLAVEASVPGSANTDTVLALPLDALAELEGRDDTLIALKRTGPGQVRAAWRRRGRPHATAYAVPDTGPVPAFPALPESDAEMPGGLMSALASACEVADDQSARYALQCVQLRGRQGDVVATDGRHLLVQRIGAWPWEGDVMLPRTPIFGCRALAGTAPVRVGRTASHVVFRIDAWTIAVAIEATARYPHVDDVLAGGSDLATVVRLAEADAAGLAAVLDELPGTGDGPDAVTLECNGRIAVRAATGAGGPREVVLSHSAYEGAAVTLCSGRPFLQQALRLGLRELRLSGPRQPAFAIGRECTYAWQPLDPTLAIPAPDQTADVVTTPPPLPETPVIPRTPMPETSTRNGAGHPEARATATSTATVAEPPAAGMAELIREADRIAAELGELRTRLGRLVTALRRKRKQDRRVRETLASLREIGLAEIAG